MAQNCESDNPISMREDFSEFSCNHWLILLRDVGIKAYSRGSLEFRAVFVSLLLFEGSYVWIKFRDRENDYSEGCVYKRSMVKTSGEKYVKWEPRYRPPGTPPRSRTRLKLGEYYSEDDAKVVLQVAKFYYEEKQGVVDLRDGFQFPIPPMSEQVRKSSAEEIEKWVRETAKQVLKDYNKRKAYRGRVSVGNPADENLRDIKVNQEPEGQSDLETGQQSLEKQNLDLKLLITKYLLAGPVSSNRECPSQHLQRENRHLKNILEQVKTLSGVLALEPPPRSDMESMNQLLILQSELEANQHQRLPPTQQPLEQPHSGESLENEGLEGTLQPRLEELGWYFDEVPSTIPENSSIQTWSHLLRDLE